MLWRITEEPKPAGPDINWGAWAELGFADTPGAALARALFLGIRSIAPEQGLAVLTDYFGKTRPSYGGARQPAAVSPVLSSGQ
jgi:hypothetical protein